MSELEDKREKIYLKEIEPLVEKELIEEGFLRIENGEKVYLYGACRVQWDIQKRLMKEKFGVDWKSPADKYPSIIFD